MSAEWLNLNIPKQIIQILPANWICWEKHIMLYLCAANIIHCSCALPWSKRKYLVFCFRERTLFVWVKLWKCWINKHCLKQRNQLSWHGFQCYYRLHFPELWSRPRCFWVYTFMYVCKSVFNVSVWVTWVSGTDWNMQWQLHFNNLSCSTSGDEQYVSGSSY